MTAVGFDVSFDSERSFRRSLVPEDFRSRFSQDMSTIPQTKVFILLYKQKTELDRVMHNAFPGEAVWSFAGYSLSWIIGLIKVLLDVEQFFQM